MNNMNEAQKNDAVRQDKSATNQNIFSKEELYQYSRKLSAVANQLMMLRDYCDAVKAVSTDDPNLNRTLTDYLINNTIDSVEDMNLTVQKISDAICPEME